MDPLVTIPPIRASHCDLILEAFDIMLAAVPHGSKMANAEKALPVWLTIRDAQDKAKADAESEAQKKASDEAAQAAKAKIVAEIQAEAVTHCNP